MKNSLNDFSGGSRVGMWHEKLVYLVLNWDGGQCGKKAGRYALFHAPVFELQRDEHRFELRHVFWVGIGLAFWVGNYFYECLH